MEKTHKITIKLYYSESTHNGEDKKAVELTYLSVF